MLLHAPDSSAVLLHAPDSSAVRLLVRLREASWGPVFLFPPPVQPQRWADGERR